MTREIRLRFPATCVDCGASLSVGTEAFWFSRGRVSCCHKLEIEADRPQPGATRAESKVPAPVTAKANTLVGCQQGSELERVAAETNIPAEALACGLNAAQVHYLAQVHSTMLLLVRLGSGARLIVPACDAEHVLGCIVESCRDKIRDVSRSPNQ